MNTKRICPRRWQTKKTPITRIGCAVAVVFFAVSAPVRAESPIASVQASEGQPEAHVIEQLKRDYLLCNRAAIDGLLDGAAIKQCSIIYERLKRLAFDGDFGRLYAWSSANPVKR